MMHLVNRESGGLSPKPRQSFIHLKFFTGQFCRNCAARVVNQVLLRPSIVIVARLHEQTPLLGKKRRRRVKNVLSEKTLHMKCLLCSGCTALCNTTKEWPQLQAAAAASANLLYQLAWQVHAGNTRSRPDLEPKKKPKSSELLLGGENQACKWWTDTKIVPF
jgi:hypothetical protein